MPNVAGKECTRIAQKMNTDEKNVAESEGREYRYIRVHPHMFRHTFATSLLEADVDIRYIQEMLGHSSINITEIYTHVALAKQRSILATKHPRNNFNI